jgi:hypothetical protein
MADRNPPARESPQMTQIKRQFTQIHFGSAQIRTICTICGHSGPGIESPQMMK